MDLELILMKSKRKRGGKKTLLSLSKGVLSLQMIDAASAGRWDEVRALIDAGRRRMKR